MRAKPHDTHRDLLLLDTTGATPMSPRNFFLVPLAALVACQAPPRPEFKEVLNSQLPERPYSEVVRVGDAFFFSGKVGANDSTRALTEGRTVAEVRNIMEAFQARFGELGLTFADVVQGTVFLTNSNDYEAMNEVYGEYFPANPPARSTVIVAALPGDAAAEIAFIAVRSPR